MEIMEGRNKGGKFTDGHKGFKPKGATNLLTRGIKEKFEELIESYPIEMMIQDLHALKPAERLHVVAGLLEYFMPKLNKTDHGLAISDEIITIQLPTFEQATVLEEIAVKETEGGTIITNNDNRLLKP